MSIYRTKLRLIKAPPRLVLTRPFFLEQEWTLEGDLGSGSDGQFDTAYFFAKPWNKIDTSTPCPCFQLSDIIWIMVRFRTKPALSAAPCHIHFLLFTRTPHRCDRNVTGDAGDAAPRRRRRSAAPPRLRMLSRAPPGRRRLPLAARLRCRRVCRSIRACVRALAPTAADAITLRLEARQ